MASFYTYNNQDNSSILKGGFTANLAVKIPILSNALVGSKYATVINSVSVQSSDTVQYFLTLSDLIEYFHFGKGVGNINIAGTIFCTCDGAAPGIDKFYDIIGENRNKYVYVIIGTKAFNCIINTYSANLTSEPAPLIEFSIALGVVSDGIKSTYINDQIACKTSETSATVAPVAPTSSVSDLNDKPGSVGSVPADAVPPYLAPKG